MVSTPQSRILSGILGTWCIYVLADGFTKTVREPMPPPIAYHIISATDYQNYKGKNVEMSARPVFIPDTLVPSKLEIGLREGDTLLKAVANDIRPSIFSFRPANELSPEKVEEVYKIIKERILTGETQPINLWGKLSRDVLEVYGVNIDGTEYYLLQHR